MASHCSRLLFTICLRFSELSHYAFVTAMLIDLVYSDPWEFLAVSFLLTLDVFWGFVGPPLPRRYCGRAFTFGWVYSRDAVCI